MMAADTGAKFIRRNRPPRVQISYQDPYDANKKVELPFVMGVLADLSGSKPGVEPPDVAERKFIDFDMDDFEEKMAKVQPGAAFRVENKLRDGSGEQLSVELQFSKMADFGPVEVARQVPGLAKLLEAREQLANLLRYMDGKAAAGDELTKLLSNPQLMAAVREQLSGKSKAVAGAGGSNAEGSGDEETKTE